MQVDLEALEHRLKQPLPQLRAHQKMMKHRLAMEQYDFEALKPRESAVLVLIHQQAKAHHLTLIKRPTYNGPHSGQISFPGGKKEPDDRSLQHTAIREAEEEVGIDPSRLRLLGSLSPLYIPPSNFMVQPYVAFYEGLAEYTLEEKEVESIIEPPLSFFLSETNIQSTRVKTHQSVTLNVNAFVFGEHIIWGATSMILKELSEVIQTLPTQS